MRKIPEISQLIDILCQTKQIVVLTGAGISAESGIPTFRGEEGLWKQYRAEDLATPIAFIKDPKLVWEWYDWRRGIIASKKPNAGHKILGRWEKIFPNFILITQNIDGLHQKAGSKNILELHGNIWKVRCTEERTITENHDIPLEEIPPHCPDCGALLRPHVVWFGESLSSSVLYKAFQVSSSCEIIFSIGTSAVVQPAASLPLAAAEANAKIVEINPDPTPLTSYADFSFRGKAGEILPLINKELNKKLKDRKE
ncbi:MAG: NAD-dependent deacylase [Candidatus Aminicenantes bacterium]|nr:MAG: NAD-dependent deacylase [Candidatus Aminicenantes bacterium]